jgi:hypothetical protein
MITENNRTGNSETASVAVKASAKDSKINLKKLAWGLVCLR